MQGSGTLRTSNGEIVLEDAKGEFDVSTSNGSIDVRALEGSATLHTSNGSVTVKVEGTPSLQINVSTSNGAVATTLPILTTSTGDEGRLVGAIGEGEATLVIRTSNGSVRIQ